MARHIPKRFRHHDLSPAIVFDAVRDLAAARGVIDEVAAYVRLVDSLPTVDDVDEYDDRFSEAQKMGDAVFAKVCTLATPQAPATEGTV